MPLSHRICSHSNKTSNFPQISIIKLLYLFSFSFFVILPCMGFLVVFISNSQQNELQKMLENILV